MKSVELVVDCQAQIGESPTWFALGEALFWIDVKAPCLYRLDTNGAVHHWALEADVGAFALFADGSGAVVALRNGVFGLDFASGVLNRIAAAPFDQNLFRFNEGICDARGRFWIGVMFDPLPAFSGRPSEKASIQRFSFAEGLVPAFDQSELHDGFAWDCDHEALYLAHSRSHHVYRATFDLASGALGTPEPFIKVGEGKEMPAGAAMDEEGCYWCAVHGAAALHRYDAGGRLILQVALPVSQPTMCSFVGTNLDEMVITSARENLTREQLEREPHAGGVFHLRPGVRGLPRPCVVK